MGHSCGVQAAFGYCGMFVHVRRDGPGTVELELVWFTFHQLAQILASMVFFLYQLVRLLICMHVN